MTSLLAQGFHTDLAILLLVLFFEGIDRIGSRYRTTKEEDKREEMIRRGYIL